MTLRLLSDLAARFDRAFEAGARRSAQLVGRRSALDSIGRLLVGAAVVPLLPFDRSGGAAHAADASSDKACEYWRYCALDGFLCTCCGGSVTSCPPGAEASKVTWVGTCQNPGDGKSYLISYNDCCGKTTCGRCGCNTNMRERPGYRMGIHNDINWCMANESGMYHCTVAVAVGIGDDE